MIWKMTVGTEMLKSISWIIAEIGLMKSETLTLYGTSVLCNSHVCKY